MSSPQAGLPGMMVTEGLDLRSHQGAHAKCGSGGCRKPPDCVVEHARAGAHILEAPVGLGDPEDGVAEQGCLISLRVGVSHPALAVKCRVVAPAEDKSQPRAVCAVKCWPLPPPQASVRPPKAGP